MRHFLLVLAILTLAAPAMADRPSVSATLAEWKQLRDPDMATISFAQGLKFLTDNPSWPDEKTIRIRTEAAALLEHPDHSTMQAFCTSMPPISGRGMIACYQAQAGDEADRKQWLHQGWIQGDFAENEERNILSTYANDLTHADHVARMERLLYEHKPTAAKRLMDILSSLNQPVYTVRIAMIQHDRKAKKKLQALSKTDQRNPGILFERIAAALDAHQIDTLVSLVKLVPANAPYPELWWPARNIAIREALSNRNYTGALSILNNRGTLKGEQMAEALWLRGWIMLEFQHNPNTAYKDFRELYTQVNTPVSKARAAYWAGRAATHNGNPDIAHDWYEKAAQHPTVFYGQLAALTLHPDSPLSLPETPAASAEERQAFSRDPVVQATRQLDSDPDTTLRDHFLAHLTNSADSPARMAMVADLANELGGVSSGVKIAKLALRKQVVLIARGWPKIDLPSGLGVEPPLALAISRQESEFDPQAQSGAHARGLMQLLPDTAKLVARKHDLPYTKNSLDNPNENLVLGTTYLGQIIQGFDGSYILGIASYNAGPSNVRRWLGSIGDLPKNPNAAVDWIESIPFGETRNYVMRVLENLEIYRTLTAPDSSTTLIEDLTR